MADGTEIKQLYDERYNDAYASWSPYYPKAAEDLRFYLGDQWTLEEKKNLRDQGRNAFVFNRTRRNINMVTGYQRKNRLSSVVSPVENSDQLTADQLSQLLLYVMQYGNAYQVISDAFAGAVKTGWNLVSVYMDYRDDPLDGDIKFGRDPYSGFIVDPNFTQLDFSDCSYLIRRKYVGVDQAVSLLPKHEKEIRELQKYGYPKDDKFTWLMYQTQPDLQNLTSIDEFYEQKWKNIPMLVDMETGEFTEWDGDRERLQVLKQIYPNIEIVKRPKRYIERHMIVNGEYITSDKNPYGLDEYLFTPVVAQFDSEAEDWSLKIQSLVRCQVDPQREANRRRSQMSDIFDSQINSGWIAEEDSVVNPHSLFQTSQGKVIWKKRDLVPNALEKIPPAQVPPSAFQLQELYDRDMVDILGLNDAALGIVESGNESGIMMMLRQGSAITNLQDVFDNLRFSQKLISKKVLKLIQTWSPKKIERIIRQKPSDQFYNKDFEKYDITVGEGVLTDSQKLIYFRQLIDLKQLTDTPSQGPITAQMLVEAAPIQGKSELMKQIVANEQSSQQAQQEQNAIQQQLLDSQRQMSQAKAISDLALSKERFTRAVANMSLEDERVSKAVQDRADAALARIKAIKEIQTMDDERLFKYLTLVRAMEETSQRQEEEIKKDDVIISQRAAEDSQTQLQEEATKQFMSQLQQGINQNQQMEVPNV